MFTIIMFIGVMCHMMTVSVWWGWIMSIACDLVTFMLGATFGWLMRKYLEKKGEAPEK